MHHSDLWPETMQRHVISNVICLLLHTTANLVLHEQVKCNSSESLDGIWDEVHITVCPLQGLCVVLCSVPHHAGHVLVLGHQKRSIVTENTNHMSRREEHEASKWTYAWKKVLWFWWINTKSHLSTMIKFANGDMLCSIDHQNIMVGASNYHFKLQIQMPDLLSTLMV